MREHVMVGTGPGWHPLQKQCHPDLTLLPEITNPEIFPYFSVDFWNTVFSEKYVFSLFRHFLTNSGPLRLPSVTRVQKATFDRTVGKVCRKQRGLRQWFCSFEQNSDLNTKSFLSLFQQKYIILIMEIIVE